MTDSDRVTVVVPTREAARTLDRCLASVRAQTHPRVELVVVDNHSTDDTVSIAHRHADRGPNALPRQRLRLLRDLFALTQRERRVGVREVHAGRTRE